MVQYWIQISKQLEDEAREVISIPIQVHPLVFGHFLLNHNTQVKQTKHISTKTKRCFE